jgi:aryl carrier-like protein
MEQALASIWAEVLGIDEVGVDDNFFEVGGNSLLIVRVRARIREQLGRDVSLVDLFLHPTVGRLAVALTAADGAGHDLETVRERTTAQKSARQRLADRRTTAVQRRTS